MDKRVIELFAGVGGFRLGLQDSGEGWEFAWRTNGNQDVRNRMPTIAT